MSQVYTSKGLIDRNRLTVKDVITEEPNARVVASEWYLDEELVRRDAAVSILAPQDITAQQQEI